jgi:glycosyltransferase involved in cell wall biosynthesis
MSENSSIANNASEVERIFNSSRELPDYKISNMFAGLNVLGLVADNSACGYYRVVNPLHYLKMHGANIHYGSHHSMDNFMKYDFVIAPRQHSEEVYEILRFIMWEGKTVIFEIDDDLDAVQPSSPAYYAYHPGSRDLKWIHKVMSWCDGVTTTTPEMAKWCYQNNRNVGILENLIDYSFRDWNAEVVFNPDTGLSTFKPLPIQKPKEWEGLTVIGYSGGTTHQEDIPILGPQIRAILEKYENTHFAIYMSPVQATEFVETYKIPEGRYTKVPARHFVDYPTGLDGIDIGMCPLAGNQFNVAKSFLKIEEYFAKGIVPVTSNIAPYARFNTRHPGYIVNTGRGAGCAAKSLFDGVEYLLQNPDELQRRKIAGRQLMFERYSLENNIANWPATWNNIRNRKLAGDVGPPDNKLPKASYVSYGKVGPNDICPCGSGLKYKACCRHSYGP